MKGRILGIDPGERRVGIALSDPTGTIATPLCVIDRKVSDFADEIVDLCRTHEVEMIVVGLPVTLAGREGASAVAARELAAEVATAAGLPVEMQDERLTSVSAEAALLEGDVGRRQRRTHRDKVAAAILLQTFLDRQKRNEHSTDDDRSEP